MQWKQQAACAALNDNTFFPASNSTEDAQPALGICAGCPVITECLEYALANDIRYGIWGGKTYQQRAIQARRLKIAAMAEEYAEMIHGTTRTAQWERRHGIGPCATCLNAERERGRYYTTKSRTRSRASA